MTDIELKLDGMEEEDKKLNEILESDSKNIENKVRFTETEEKMIDEFSKKIDLENTNIILQYGSGAQKKISNFSEKTLDAVKNKDLGQVGSLLDKMLMDIKTMDQEEAKGPLGFFKKTENKIDKIKARYKSSEKNINEITRSLENHQITLMKDISMLDQMYDLNEEYYKEISMYIEAGMRKLEDLYNNDLPALERAARESNLPLDAQKVNDLKSQANRFEEKLHDLDLTRMVSIQMAPQIRMVQSSNSIMAEKIQTTITTTIPLWKNQMVLALGMHHTDQAIRTQEMVTDLTNELLRKNADSLKQNTIETARASERGIVDLETIKHTNDALISTIEEVRKIQIEGASKRRKAQDEIRNLESELKSNLTRRN